MVVFNYEHGTFQWIIPIEFVTDVHIWVSSSFFLTCYKYIINVKCHDDWNLLQQISLYSKTACVFCAILRIAELHDKEHKRSISHMLLQNLSCLLYLKLSLLVRRQTVPGCSWMPYHYPKTQSGGKRLNKWNISGDTSWGTMRNPHGGASGGQPAQPMVFFFGDWSYCTVVQNNLFLELACQSF